MISAGKWLRAKLSRWDVVGILAPLIYATGVGAMYGGDYLIAAVLYCLSIFWVMLRICVGRELRGHPQRPAVIILVAILAIVLAGTSSAWDGYKYRSRPKLVGYVGYLGFEPFYRFYQHPPAYFERIDTEIYLSLTNQTGQPIHVADYAVAALVGDRWRHLTNLPGLGLEPDEIGLMSPNRLYLSRIDLSENGFDYLMRKRALAGGEDIEAWMFFRSGIAAVDQSKVKKFRITITDSSQEAHTFFCAYPGPRTIGKLKILAGELVSRSLREAPQDPQLK